ncbi:5-formyltetrahydrofolate cyclo-ligase [Hondaea fermentalgiana]|uniref:5-formyltetrahydrofolate cyclo-ligase n=1 Tax=Hondaea fermentalgiana TaxID=2315210 RepID=A0A2R5GGK1_9STRA|nr:5-formyltetrahydrofolate cyclo-ligase [Hondaea fermentalgiana]|eukprot:GBG29725.1 5-formyltetrahydrofolate cyclo-ligase [Hondaea fermentalgiana]
MMKKTLRREIATVLKNMGEDKMHAASKQLAEHIKEIPRAQTAERVSIYLAMKNEAQTQTALEWLFDAKKRVFVPKIIGAGSEDMRMPELASLEELAGLDKFKWGIPEFTLEQLEERADGVDSSVEDLVDVVFTPGVAFTTDGFRLGHGKGYYDAFLKKLQRARKAAGLPPAYTVGLSLDEQILDAVPVEDHDVALDAVATPSAVYYCAGDKERP